MTAFKSMLSSMAGKESMVNRLQLLGVRSTSCLLKNHPRFLLFTVFDCCFSDCSSSVWPAYSVRSSWQSIDGMLIIHWLLEDCSTSMYTYGTYMCGFGDLFWTSINAKRHFTSQQHCHMTGRQRSAQVAMNSMFSGCVTAVEVEVWCCCVCWINFLHLL